MAIRPGDEFAFDINVGGRVVRVTIDGDALIVGDKRVTTSGREREVFLALARRPGAVIAKARLARDIWGDAKSTRAVDTTISRLRRRLGAAGAAVRTTRNRGYWLDVTGMLNSTGAQGSRTRGARPTGSGT